ncbi:ester cyclase [uncultured Tateyamaria sp.]|uniref:ester cyclase n=1 Tax=uncultured Tateyamaria sp. TaxID=455651 RepID=UPI001D44A174|nr:nuclear transport factor 2 family protein [uncultured Tateyamaria sp.]MCB4379768.1 nuclear transport factor 2 family protein [Synechococcus sp. MU1644]
MSMTVTAREFFEACETGKGWDGCAEYCSADASFSCQSSALEDTLTLAAYAEWMKGLLTPIPDGHYELKGFASDEDRGIVLAFAVFHGTQSGPGGPVDATGAKVASDYVYALEFAGGKITHMTKIWNDGHALTQLGWA